MAKASARIDALRPEVASSVFDADESEEEVSDEQPTEEDE